MLQVLNVQLTSKAAPLPLGALKAGIPFGPAAASLAVYARINLPEAGANAFHLKGNLFRCCSSIRSSA